MFKRTLGVMVLAVLLSTDSAALAPAAPAGAPAEQGEDAWMAALQSAMREAQAGDRDTAIRSLARMRDAAGENLNRRGIAGLYLGQMLHWTRRGKQAHEALAGALTDLYAVREPCDAFLVKAREYAWQTALEMRDLNGAVVVARDQLKCVQGGTDDDLRRVTQARLARAELLSGDTAAAERSLAAADVVSADARAARRDRIPVPEIEELRGMVAAAAGRHADAKRLLEQRLEALRANRVPPSFATALVHAYHAFALKGTGHTPDAELELAESFRILRGSGRHLAPWITALSADYEAVKTP